MDSVTPSILRRFSVVLNRESGTIAGLGAEHVAEGLKQIYAELELQVDVQAVPGAEIEDALKRARDSDSDAVIVGGGDGTVATAATIMAGSDKPLGVLPLGTFNLAARDLGMNLNWEIAARSLAEAPQGEMDLLDVEGKLYLCVIVLGFYPTLAMGQKEYHGHWMIKAVKTAALTLRSMATFPPLRLILNENGKEVRFRTRMALLANNDYEDIFGIIPRRNNLDAGYFTVYVSRHRTRWGLIRSFFAWMIGRWKQDKELTAFRATDLEIHARRRRRVAVMMDGELQKLPVPFRVKILPKALRVLAPRLAPPETTNPV